MEATDLKKAGLKATLPRIRILQILEDSPDKHLSAEDVYKILNERYKLALVTSTGPELVTHINKLLSIEKKFDLMINSTHTQSVSYTHLTLPTKA